MNGKLRAVLSRGTLIDLSLVLALCGVIWFAATDRGRVLADVQVQQKTIDEHALRFTRHERTFEQIDRKLDALLAGLHELKVQMAREARP